MNTSKKTVIVLMMLVSLVSGCAVIPLVRGPGRNPADKEALAQGISATLEAERAEYGASEPLRVRFTLTNNSDETLSVLKWNTPLDGFNSDMLVVQRDGGPVAYLGRTVKRGAPGPADYVTIRPSESVTTVFDLAEGYAASQAGEYSVQYVSRLLDIGTADPEELATRQELISVEIQSNVVTFRLHGSETPPAGDAPLIGTAWELVSLLGSAPIQDKQITLRFAEASIEGSTGCNTYGGGYTVSGDRLVLSGVYATEMGCMEPEGIMRQERTYLDALAAVARYRVQGDRLELHDGAGAQSLVFVAAGSSGMAQATRVAAEPTPTASASPASTPTSEPPAGFKRYVEAASGVSVWVPEDWIIVEPVVAGGSVALQSYPEDKYVGGEPFQPGDSKCDLHVHPEHVSVEGLLPRDQSSPPVTVVSQQEIVLRSGRTGIRVEVDSMGRSLALFTEIHRRAVVLACFGALEPFDEIASTLGAADEQ